MEVNVKGPGATKFKLSAIEKTLTVAEFKAKCVEECKLPVDQQRLFLKGKLLKEDDTLEAANIKEGTTLFLVKGASQPSSATGAVAAASSGAPAAEEKKEDEVPVVATGPCKGGCGFFGSSKFDGHCSKCFGEKNKKEGKAPETPAAKPEEPAKDGEKKEAGAEGSAAAESSEPAKVVRQEQTDKTKCFSCSKKCGLTGFECRCGYVFCAKHRHAEEHDCDFDHKTAGREIIAKANEKVVGNKMDGL